MTQFTTDKTEIEQWADQHNAVPVRSGQGVELLTEEEMTAEHEQVDWETFHETVADQDRVVMYHEDPSEGRQFEVSEHSQALERMELEEGHDRDEIKQRLLEGETVTGTIKETTVVKETIVEEATLESEIVDQNVVDQQVTDVELLERTCQSCTTDTSAGTVEYDQWANFDRFLVDDANVTTGEQEQYEKYPYGVSVDVDERWMVTIEELEEFIVESRITDVDVTETDTIDSQNIESQIDIDAVHNQLLQTIDLGWTETAEDVVDADTHDIESEFTEDDRITTTLTSSRLIEKELSERWQLTTDVVAGELLARETHEESVVDSGLAEREGVAEQPPAEPQQQPEGRMVPTDDDVGKPVVSAGEEIGMITEVEGEVAYVDPEPGLTERIMGRLGWSDKDEEDLVLEPEQISSITDDAVEIAGNVEEP